MKYSRLMLSTYTTGFCLPDNPADEFALALNFSDSDEHSIVAKRALLRSVTPPLPLQFYITRNRYWLKV